MIDSVVDLEDSELCDEVLLEANAEERESFSGEMLQ